MINRLLALALLPPLVWLISQPASAQPTSVSKPLLEALAASGIRYYPEARSTPIDSSSCSLLPPLRAKYEPSQSLTANQPPTALRFVSALSEEFSRLLNLLRGSRMGEYISTNDFLHATIAAHETQHLANMLMRACRGLQDGLYIGASGTHSIGAWIKTSPRFHEWLDWYLRRSNGNSPSRLNLYAKQWSSSDKEAAAVFAEELSGYMAGTIMQTELLQSSINPLEGIPAGARIGIEHSGLAEFLHFTISLLSFQLASDGTSRTPAPSCSDLMPVKEYLSEMQAVLKKSENMLRSHGLQDTVIHGVASLPSKQEDPNTESRFADFAPLTDLDTFLNCK